MNISRYANIDQFVNIPYIFLLARRAYSISASSDCSVAVYDFLGKKIGVCGQVFIYIVTLLNYQGLKNPLARCPGLVISTFGLAEIISCMPDGLVKKIYRILTNWFKK
jgi:hypothetical protein